MEMNVQTGDAEKKTRTQDGKEKEAAPIKSTADVVTPSWRIPYDLQVQQKGDAIKKILQRIVHNIRKSDPQHKKVLAGWKMTEKGLCCPFEGIKPSPIQNYYRNKSEFTIGLNASGQPAVGFQLGNFRDGVIVIGEPDECLNVSVEAKAISQSLTSYLRGSGLACFNKINHEGFWRIMTVRQGFRTGEVMAIIQGKAADYPPDVVQNELDGLKEYFTKEVEKGLKLSSLIFQENNGVNNSTPTDSKQVILFGNGYIVEEMCGLKFQVSPGAFFQVNTPAAEVLYNTILEYAKAERTSTFLDVCCGTGTIGLAASKSVCKVIGVELSAPAIADAHVNMNLNGIKNAEFHCSKAESVMQELLQRNAYGRLVAVVDPPRSGVHANVSRALRTASNIDRVVYVSCNPEAGLVQNALELCRAPSGRFKGVPFVPVLACAVDLFPHTNHCEAIMVFERADPALWRVQYGHLSAPEKQSASIEKESSDNQETEAPAEAEDSTNVDEEVAQQNETGDDGAAE
eukprot:TRINITY_DN448_c0_g1_i4.p1 TRINITY_DN448_c0_g1~~TRINITY_DN448_c0_g1_i4.p1  ORF type:complete len:514 (-),score=106.65 TRINITY_DN448_c0_g1_i4:204-1745(-)